MKNKEQMTVEDALSLLRSELENAVETVSEALKMDLDDVPNNKVQAIMAFRNQFKKAQSVFRNEL